MKFIIIPVETKEEHKSKLTKFYGSKHSVKEIEENFLKNSQWFDKYVIDKYAKD